MTDPVPRFFSDPVTVVVAKQDVARNRNASKVLLFIRLSSYGLVNVLAGGSIDGAMFREFIRGLVLGAVAVATFYLLLKAL